MLMAEFEDSNLEQFKGLRIIAKLPIVIAYNESWRLIADFAA